jgi:hypothetical protein
MSRTSVDIPASANGAKVQIVGSSCTFASVSVFQNIHEIACKSPHRSIKVTSLDAN